MAEKKPSKKTPIWEIMPIRERGKFLGYAEARDAEAAIKEAIERFQITNPEQQKRLVARREK
jgi:hypothetical protein